MKDAFVQWDKIYRDESVNYFYELVEKSHGRIRKAAVSVRNGLGMDRVSQQQGRVTWAVRRGYGGV